MSGAEVDDGFLLLDRRERVGHRLERAQANVVVEHVEVGGVARSVVGGGGRFVGGRGGRVGRRDGRPSAYPSAVSAFATLPRSAVKSVSTFSVELTVTTDTMSALLIFSLTYFCAESTARCTSSGCMELTSNSSVIRRRPAIDSEVGTSAGGAACAAATDDGDRVCSWSFASTPASRSAVSTRAGALSLISSKLKLRTCCGRPSSRISKSSAVRPRTIAPLLSRTMASTVITSRRERKTPPGAWTGAGAPPAGATAAAAAAPTARWAPARSRRRRRQRVVS